MRPPARQDRLHVGHYPTPGEVGNLDGDDEPRGLKADSGNQNCKQGGGI